ncbi:MAG: hypothetical protein V3U03_12490 [Myxococcota bacterium]
MGDLFVECRQESDAEVPVRFGWSGRMREVSELLDQWQGADHRYFRVRADDGGLYILRHDLRSGVWLLTFFRRDDAAGQPPETSLA